MGSAPPLSAGHAYGAGAVGTLKRFLTTFCPYGAGVFAMVELTYQRQRARGAPGFGENRIGFAETFQDKNKPGRTLLYKLIQDYFKQEDLTSRKKTC
jgi:hypothetical protein